MFERLRDKTGLIAAGRLTAAVLGGVLIFFILTKLCQPKYLFGLEVASPETEMWRAFYNLPENSLDILFLGSSHIYNAVDPEQFEELDGRAGFDLSTSNQDASLSYYLLKEALQTQRPETIVMDVYGMTLSPYEKESSYKRTFDDMRWGQAKLRGIRDWLPHMEGETLLPRIFTILDFHSRWKELGAVDFNEGAFETVRRGFCPTDITTDSLAERVYDTGTEEFTVSASTEEYFRMLVYLCQAEKIDLILIKTPDVKWSSGDHAAFELLASRYGLRFIDFNETERFEAIGLDPGTDWRNDRHLNSRGAGKFTKVLAQELQKAG